MMISKTFGDLRTASVELPDSLISEDGEPIQIEIDWEPDSPPDDWEYSTEFQAWLNSELRPRVPDSGTVIGVPSVGMTQEDAWRMAAGHIAASADEDEVLTIIARFREVDLDGLKSHSRIMALAEMLISILYDASPDNDRLSIEERVDQVQGIARHLVSGFKNPTLSDDEADDFELPEWMGGENGV